MFTAQLLAYWFACNSVITDNAKMITMFSFAGAGSGDRQAFYCLPGVILTCILIAKISIVIGGAHVILWDIMGHCPIHLHTKIMVWVQHRALFKTESGYYNLRSRGHCDV